jgi:hypothetical protein
MSQARARLWVMIALVAFSSAYIDLRVRAHPGRAYAEYIPGVMAGTEEAPGRYRILAPWIVDTFSRVTGWTPQSSWHITRALWFGAAWVGFQLYLETWFAPIVAFGGMALAAALLPMTYTNSWAHPDHIPELALITWGCLAIARGKDAWFAVALALAAFNRETSVLLVLVYFLARPLTLPHLMRSAMVGGLWTAIYIGLRVWRGFAHYDYLQWGRNIEFLKLLPPNYDPYYRMYAWFVVILIVALTIAAWPALVSRSTPRPVLAAAAAVPVLLVIGVVFSSIIETRIFTPVLPLMLPALMFAIDRPIPRPGELPS